MSAHCESDQDRVCHGHGHRRGGLRPGDAIQRVVTGERGAGAHQLEPARGEQTADTGTGGGGPGAGAGVHGEAVARRDHDIGKGRVRRGGLADHQADFGPFLGTLNGGDSGDDGTVPGEWQRSEAERIGGAPNVVARATEYEGATRSTGVTTDPGGADAANIELGPGRRERGAARSDRARSRGGASALGVHGSDGVTIARAGDGGGIGVAGRGHTAGEHGENAGRNGGAVDGVGGRGKRGVPRQLHAGARGTCDQPERRRRNGRDHQRGKLGARNDLLGERRG